MKLDQIIARAQREMAGGPVELALGTVHELDNLRPIHVPPRPQDSDVFAERMRSASRPFADELEQARYVQFLEELKLRADAIAENERRLTATLWAEQALRKAGRPEADLVRDFNRMEWGVLVPAPEGCDERHTIMKERTASCAVRLNRMPPSAASNNQQRHLKAVE